MFDLYLFNTIVNTVWYIFTILFVLYRFTSFFSYIYNFSRFCGKLFTGVHYIYTLTTKNFYRYQNIDVESQIRPKSTFEKFKETCKKKWAQLFGKSSATSIPKYETVFPLVETTTLHNSSGYHPNSSGYHPNSSGYHPNSSGYHPNSSRPSYSFNNSEQGIKSSIYPPSNSILEKQLFDQKMDELMDDNSHYYDPNYVSITSSDNKVKFSIPEYDEIPITVSDETPNTLQIIHEAMDELDKEAEETGSSEKVVKKIRFNTNSIIKSYSDSDSESEPLFHKYNKIQ